MKWDSKKFASSLRHDQENKNYNANMRQLIHVAYKLAAQQMEKYYRLLEANEKIVAECVYENVYDRHIKRLFDL
jgi:predicted transcriptional regulator